MTQFLFDERAGMVVVATRPVPLVGMIRHRPEPAVDARRNNIAALSMGYGMYQCSGAVVRTEMNIAPSMVHERSPIWWPRATRYGPRPSEPRSAPVGSTACRSARELR